MLVLFETVVANRLLGQMMSASILVPSTHVPDDPLINTLPRKFPSTGANTSFKNL